MNKYSERREENILRLSTVIFSLNVFILLILMLCDVLSSFSYMSLVILFIVVIFVASAAENLESVSIFEVGFFTGVISSPFISLLFWFIFIREMTPIIFICALEWTFLFAYFIFILVAELNPKERDCQETREKIANKIYLKKNNEDIVDISGVLIDSAYSNLNKQLAKCFSSESTRAKQIRDNVKNLLSSLKKLNKIKNPNVLKSAGLLLKTEKGLFISMDSVYSDKNFLEVINELDENEFSRLIGRYTALTNDLNNLINTATEAEQIKKEVELKNKKEKEMAQLRNKIKFM